MRVKASLSVVAGKLENSRAPARKSRLILVDPDNVGCIGRQLRMARESLGLELTDLVRMTRVPERYLRAFEEADFRHYPDPAYVRGHLRAHAEAVGLHPDMIARVHGAATDGELARPPALRSGRLRPDKGPRPAMCLGVLLSVAALWFGFAPATDEVASLSRAPAVAASSGAAVALSGPELYARRDAWIRIQGRDGTVFVSRELRAGESYAPRLGHGWSVSAHDGGAFVWRLDGRESMPVGADGQRISFLDIDTALEKLRRQSMG